MDTSAPAIFRKLKEIAPNISFSVEWDEDPHFEWDGDGPDPREEGYVPHDVTVSAKTIIHGEEYEGKEYLGGSYDRPDGQDPDIHGYLPQMLREAVKELLSGLPDTMSQANEAMAYLERVMHERHANQMSRRRKRKQDWKPGRPKK